MLCDYIIDFSPTAKESNETPLNVFFILCLPSQPPFIVISLTVLLTDGLVCPISFAIPVIVFLSPSDKTKRIGNYLALMSILYNS